MSENVVDKLAGYLKDIREEKLEIYGESTKIMKEVRLGSGEWFEIFYEPGNDAEIVEAFFCSQGQRIQLDDQEVETLSARF